MTLWAPCPRHPSYQISSEGELRAADGYILRGDNGGKVQPDGQDEMIYRLVLEAFRGPAPEGQIARHLNDDRTDNRLANLAWGTYSDNAHDAVRNGKHANAAKTHCKNGHELVDKNVFLDQGRRQCRECNRARSKATRERTGT